MMRFMNTLKHISNLGLAYKAKKVIWGEKAVLSQMKDIKLIVLAKEAGPNIVNKINKKAFYYQIPIHHSLTLADIKKAIGKDTVCIGITDEGFKEMMK